MLTMFLAQDPVSIIRTCCPSQNTRILSASPSSSEIRRNQKHGSSSCGHLLHHRINFKTRAHINPFGRFIKKQKHNRLTKEGLCKDHFLLVSAGKRTDMIPIISSLQVDGTPDMLGFSVFNGAIEKGPVESSIQVHQRNILIDRSLQQQS